MFIEAEQVKLRTDIYYHVFEDGKGELSIRASMLMTLILERIITKNGVKIEVRSDAFMGGADLEVTIILGTACSLAGSRIVALREAACDFADIVAEDV